VPHADPSHATDRPISPTPLTQSQAQRNAIVQRAGEVTNKLAEVLTDLSFVKEAEVRARTETTRNLLADQSLNVTTVRERANDAAMEFTLQAIKLQGEADALRLALSHYDRILNHYTFEG